MEKIVRPRYIWFKGEICKWEEAKIHVWSELATRGATFGDAPCTAYEVYCGIGEILFLAQSKGISGRTMVELEEKVAKCTSMKWREYDIPGDLVY